MTRRNGTRIGATLLVVACGAIAAPGAADPQAPPVAATTQLSGPPQNQLRDPAHEAATPSVPGANAASSKCGIANDATYGFSVSNPVKVGGGPMSAAAREISYFDALRGPAGQGIHYRRTGSRPDSTNSTTILDLYELTYEGLAKPLYVYADVYHWEAPKAPKNLICGVAMDLTHPGPDPIERSEQAKRLAVELGAKAVVPIPLDSDGTTAHGVIFDHARIVAQAARVAAAAGKPLDPLALPAALLTPHMVAIAYPQMCNGRSVAPKSIALVDVNGNAPIEVGTVKGSAVTQIVPGIDVADDALAIAYGLGSMISGVRAVIEYEGPACTAAEISLPINAEPAKLVRSVDAVVPRGIAPPPPDTMVVMQVFIDADGNLRAPAYVSGPEALIDAASAASKEWRVTPATMNGAPILEVQNIGIRFKTP